ncbi:MAG: tetratricopeptide repeat protein, partial [Myxococcota bacterium]
AADPAWGRQRAVEVEVLAGRGRVDEVAAKGERLLADATDAGWTDVLPDVLAHLAWARRHRGDPSEAAGLAERARDLWAAAGEARRELRSAAELAAIYLALGRALEAEATARAILPVATARGWADLVARALVVLANLHEYAGRFEEAEADGRRALDLALSVGDEAVAARAARRVVGALVALGRVAEAEGLQRETVERSRRLGVTHGLAMDRNLLGEILRRRGDLVEAARWYADSLDLCRRLGADPVIPSLNLAQVYLTLGEAADALAIVEGVLARDPEGLQRIGARVIGVAVAARTGDVERFGAWWPGLGEELARARYADPDFAALLGRAADDLAARGDPRAEEVRAVALAQAAATHRDTPVGPPGAPPTAISS